MKRRMIKLPDTARIKIGEMAFTYTATSELYESHLAEADAMLAAIHFE